MAVKSIADLKLDMPIGVPASISAQDIHNLIDTMESRTSGSAIKNIQVKTTSYTATLSDSGSVIVFNSSAPVTLTLPNSLPAGWYITVVQAQSGQVSIVVTGGALLNVDGHQRTSGQGAILDLLITSNAGTSPVVSLSGDTTDEVSQTRYDFSGVTDLVAVWDASDYTSRTPPDSTSLTSLASRATASTVLTAASAGGGSIAAILSNPSFVQTSGGNGMRRLNAAAGVASNLFAGGGMMVFAVRSAAMSGVLAAKLAISGSNTNGWLLFAPDSSSLSLEHYNNTATSGSHSFFVPTSETGWNVLEIEWNSSAVNTAPVVRINGTAVSVNSIASTYSAIDDSTGTLVIGNRNWGTLATPWAGDIGEVVAISGIPTTQQKADIRTDMMAHWPAAEADPLPGPIDLSQYTMTFNEDFTDPVLSRRIPGNASTDGNLWQTSMGNGAVRWLNDERQIYVEPEYAGTSGAPLGINPYSIANSVLTITCAPVSTANQQYLPKSYTSGLITTQHSFSQLYGYFEMKARFEGLGVTGTWPAFWLLFHQTGASEFDIVEAYGVNPSTVFQTTHQATGSSAIETPFAWTTGWHTYGLKWTSTELVYYLDGVPTGRRTNSTFTAGYLIANLALEGRSDRVPNPANFPVQMQIDWIRCYQPL